MTYFFIQQLYVIIVVVIVVGGGVGVDVAAPWFYHLKDTVW
jgi:hypothetical protein